MLLVAEYVIKFHCVDCCMLCRATIGQASTYINKLGREAYDDVIPNTFSSTLSTGYMCGLAYIRGVKDQVRAQCGMYGPR